ncbi:hypothetical protein BS638_12055 [Clostridium tepidum]|uniref:Uncharacterized protein n=2 Tax=Clostridium tepidum TaxID=1962263 RepID=A0A1S9I1A6_9CLOT|nr:hypothetical protein BS638_12055 [Clostridium tepidum]
MLLLKIYSLEENNMNKNAIEKMKKIIEENKNKSLKNDLKLRAVKNIGESRKAIRNKKSGGLFDK